jgi:hypothetical protein
VPGATEGEAYRWFVSALTQRDRERVIGESKKVLARRKRLRLVGWPAEMTPGQMRSWLDRQGVHVQKVKVVNGGMEVDPKTEHDSDLLRDFGGQRFEGTAEPVRVVRVETPTSLTPEEVYELVLEWLKEKEIAEDYLRPNTRGGNTPARSGTPETRRMRQVEVKEPDPLEDDCFKLWMQPRVPGK